MLRPLLCSLTFGLCALALQAPSAHATVVEIHSLSDMSRRSDVIVHARVGEQRVVREEGRIITLTEVEVIDAWKGAKAGQVLTIYQVGGSLDGVRAWIEGAHAYVPGEEVVLFAMNHRDRIVSYGVGVGKFRVEFDGAFRRVVEDIHGVVEWKRDLDGSARMSEPAPRTFPSLEGFKAEVAQSLRVSPTLQPLRAPRVVPAPVLRQKSTPHGPSQEVALPSREVTP